MLNLKSVVVNDAQCSSGRPAHNAKSGEGKPVDSEPGMEMVDMFTLYYTLSIFILNKFLKLWV